MQPPLRHNLLNFHVSDTHQGFRMSLLPNRTVFQKDTVRTWNYLADGSCHLGTHLELLKATQPGQALTSKVPVTVELRITGAPFSWDGGHRFKTRNSDEGK